jgi:DNA-binding LacI/PurR family transcriptional regulator
MTRDGLRDRAPGPAPRVRMTDIARELGISRAAVSYALNGLPGVASDTRQRVLDLAEERGWHASSSARALSGARTGVVGLVLSRPPDLLTVETFFIRFLAGLEAVLGDRGSSLLLRVIGDHPDAEVATYERWWGERRVDGVILLDERYGDPRPAALQRIGLPAVLCGGPVKAGDLPCLWTDQVRDAATAVSHLVGLGHRRIAHVSGPLEFAHERARRRGVRKAAAAHSVEVTTREASYTGSQAREVTAELLRSPDRPTAVIFGSDIMALSGLDVARECGLRAPQDLSILSWDDSNLTTLVRPALTALARDTPGYGSLAAEVLLDLLDGRHRGPVQVPASRLEVRESTGPAPRPRRRP